MKNKTFILKYFLIFLIIFVVVLSFYCSYLFMFPTIENKRMETLFKNQSQHFANLISEWIAPDIFLLDQFMLEKKLKNSFVNNGIKRIFIFNPQGEIITDTNKNANKVTGQFYLNILNKKQIQIKKLMGNRIEVVVPIYAISELYHNPMKENILGFLSITFQEPIFNNLTFSKLWQNEAIYFSFVYALILFILFLILEKISRSRLPQTHISNIPEKLNQKGIENHLISRIEQSELENLEVSSEAGNQIQMFNSFEQHFTELIESFVELGETIKNLQNLKNINLPEVNLKSINNFQIAYEKLYQNFAKNINLVPKTAKTNFEKHQEEILRLSTKLPDFMQTINILKKIIVKLNLELQKLENNTPEEIKKTNEEIKLIAESLLKQGKNFEDIIHNLEQNFLGFSEIKNYFTINIDIKTLPDPITNKELYSRELQVIEDNSEKMKSLIDTLKKYINGLQVFNKELSKRARENLLELNSLKETL